MTKKLIILGDSLVDAGNTAEVMALFGQYPFADPIYDKGVMKGLGRSSFK